MMIAALPDLTDTVEVPYLDDMPPRDVVISFQFGYYTLTDPETGELLGPPTDDVDDAIRLAILWSNGGVIHRDDARALEPMYG